MTIVETDALCKDYVMGRMVVKALRGASLKVEQGEMVAIMGPSGSGKSTFMNLVGCLDRCTSGNYLLSGQEVSRMSDAQLAKVRNQHIGFVFQSFNLLARTNALRNVELPLVYAGVKNRSELAKKALQRVGLAERMDHNPNELSGGQQQRVAIARAIVNNPDLLLADEPTGALDTTTSEEIMALFQDLNKQGMTVMVVTHEEDVALHCKRIVRFRDGLIVGDERVKEPIDAQAVLNKMRPPVAAT